MGASLLALAKSIYSILYIYLTHLFIFLVIYLLHSAVRRPHPPSASAVRFHILQTLAALGLELVV